MKKHLIDKSAQRTHLAFGIFRTKTLCGKDGNRGYLRDKPYSGEEKVFCKKCLKIFGGPSEG